MDLIHVPEKDSKFGINCKYDEDCNNFILHSTNPTGECRFSMFTICGTTPESICSDIARLAREMQKVGFEQGRKHVREALGIEG